MGISLERFDFNTAFLIDYVLSGKFEAVTSEWRHYSHTLEEFEYILMTKGTLYLSDSINNYEMHPGEFLILPPNRLIYGYKNSLCSFYWLHFKYDLNNGITTPTQESSSECDDNINHLLLPSIGKVKSSERLIVLLKQLQDSELRYHDPILDRGLTLSILAETANQCKETPTTITSAPGEHLYRSICAYIQLHINESISVKTIADTFGYSHKYLTSFFHRFAGCSIKQYMLHVKMQYAKVDLASTTLTVSQIASQLGYDDVHNFSNAFKKITGISPSAYRQMVSLEQINH